MDDLNTECSFDSQTMWVINVLGVIHWYLYNQALEDVRSTGAGIKILYCTIVFVNKAITFFCEKAYYDKFWNYYVEPSLH